MRADRVLADLGLVAAGEPSPELHTRIEEEAEGFLRAGGRLSWSEWCLLDAVTQEAFRKAGDRIRWELAGLIGATTRSATVTKAALSGEDVEAVAVREALRVTLDEVERAPDKEAGR